MDELCVTPRVGDKIRVVLEGDVNFFSGGGIAVGHGNHENIIWPDAAHVVSVSVTPRAKKVGDTAAGSELDGLPIGTVIDKGRWSLFKTVGGWRPADGVDGPYQSANLTAARTITFIPA